MKKRIFLPSLLFLLLMLLATALILLKHTADNVTFLEKAKEREMYVYPVQIQGIKVGWGGLRIFFPSALQNLSGDKDVYLKILEEIGENVWDEREDLQKTGKITIEFSDDFADVDAKLQVQGITSFKIKLPLNKIGDLSFALYEIEYCSLLFQKCEGIIKGLGWNAGYALDLNKTDTFKAAKSLESLLYFFDSIFYPNKTAGVRITCVFNVSWELPDYGVKSIQLRLPPTGGEIRPVTQDMVVFSEREIVINLNVDNREEFFQEVEKQFN